MKDLGMAVGYIGGTILCVGMFCAGVLSGWALHDWDKAKKDGETN